MALLQCSAHLASEPMTPLSVADERTSPPLTKRLPVLALALLLSACAHAPDTRPAPVAQATREARDWRDAVIYFAMIDRFDDGDPSNNDQGSGEYDPTDSRRFSGGDLAGLTRRLDYIQGLGATALWITPPVANQWWNRRVGYGGYHGYWAEDFTAVDAHFGSLDDYRTLARGLHARRMALVQDIVLNHTGDWFEYDAGWTADDPLPGYVLHPDGRGRRAPTQAPFHLNDPRREEDRAAGIYHWTPTIRDFSDRREELTFQLSGLDDLATGNPVVRAALRRSYGHWLREVGVDAFRVDTAFYVEPALFRDFLYSEDPQAPGMLRLAEQLGHAPFFAFGEGFAVDAPGSDTGARRIEGYHRDGDGPLLPGMLNFPLYGTLGDVFARGHATSELAWRIDNMLAVHADAWRMPTFIDNHDVDRFLAGGSDAALQQALLAMLALPGIPVIWQGTEQGFREQRAAMFATGWGSGGRDHFDTEAPLYRWLASAIALRREHRVLSRGRPQVLASNGSGPGAIAWRTRHEGEVALVVLNTAETPALLDNLHTGLAPGTVLEPKFALAGEAERLRIEADDPLHLVLPPRSARVWIARESAPPTASESVASNVGALHIDTLAQAADGEALHLQGRAPADTRLRLVVDGRLDAARALQADANGHWQASVDTSDMVAADTSHRLVLWDGVQASAPVEAQLQRQWQPRSSLTDAAGDDSGPLGRYRYPTESQWRQRRPADIRALRVASSGSALQVEVEMAAIVHAWNAPNGFDHVAFTLFIELPGEPGGIRVMPLQNDQLPDGMRWHRRLRTHGWSNALFHWQGADADNEGEPVAPAARIEVDASRNLVRFTFAAAALGHPATLDGIRVYLTTWDWDGGYRGLDAEPGSHRFGGGDARHDPLWMDAAGPLRLR